MSLLAGKENYFAEKFTLVSPLAEPYEENERIRKNN